VPAVVLCGQSWLTAPYLCSILLCEPYTLASICIGAVSALTSEYVPVYTHPVNTHSLLIWPSSSLPGCYRSGRICPVVSYLSYSFGTPIAQLLHSPLHRQLCTPPDYPYVSRGEGGDPIGSISLHFLPARVTQKGNIVQGKNNLYSGAALFLFERIDRLVD